MMILDSPDKMKNIKTQSGRKQILYVEDDRNSQFLVEQILRDDYDVDIAPHARDVMTWVNLKNYNLILMDMKLDEGYYGLDLVKKIKTLPGYKDVPILAVTAIAFPNDLADMVKQGCSDTITKPLIDFKLFKSKVAELLMQSQSVNNPNSSIFL
ncbi:MAG: response regulator [Bacteroidales bacterium]|nr:response regulator [Bacteroidales bacterium]